ncbi:uroporphyrinogen-III C-methyltransferase [Staphylococcus equorum]|uniref:uroporphyrinogen-III C-methyltransferase n=1 Tax=Staphylococcus equorum TaxID=246432 RepID=A0A9X4LA15_9STAP|nr:uroporphyrinogen-III C-methyltransferase [Staphylococcus equorum]MDG0844052.1 uroporphyrinogen-III C-methyltransferase [Staphylococcus equorum]MDG0859981.1 uroporphyrinogen-III C-methyltransferase [Staphylococcus equorum]
MPIIPYGKVYLIGAGPGHPELLTRKGERLLRNADIILYDRLVNPFILQLVRPEIEIINVGKEAYRKHIQQQEINEKLISAAKQHRCVVRLKGGDPAIFGRVHEEIVALSQANIDFEVIPGITTASAAVASVGLGLTIRNIAHSVTFTTGHLNKNSQQQFDVTTLLNGGTLAIYMGVKRLAKIMNDIYQATRVDYPVLLIFNVSTFNEKYITGTVTTIVEQVSDGLEYISPGMVIVGDIAAYENIKSALKPCAIKKYLISGPRLQAIEQAFDIYEKGGWCIINPDEKHELHHSQQLFLEQQLMQHFDEEISTKYIK